MRNRGSQARWASASIALLLCGCGDDQGTATVPIAVVESPPELAEPVRTGSRSIPFTELLIRSTANTPKSIVSDLFYLRDVQPIPGRAGEMSAIELSHCTADAICIHVETLGQDSYEVARLGDRKNIMRWVAAGSAVVGGKPEVRVVGVTVGRSSASPLPKTTFTVQSMLLAKGSPIETTRLLPEFEAMVGQAILAVGDCDADGQEDFLLVMLKGVECQLLSGNGLQTLATIPTRSLGIVASKIGDVDGDGSDDVFVSEENGSDFTIISPKARKVILQLTLDAALGNKVFIRDACGSGHSAKGEPSLAVDYLSADESEIEKIAVVSALTGVQLEPPMELVSHLSGLDSGRISGSDRRWLAWSTAENRAAGVVQLFIREVSVADSTVEVLLPADARRYAAALCAVAASGSTHDCLAITVSPADQVYGIPITFDPIMFLDVARCLEKR